MQRCLLRTTFVIAICCYLLLLTCAFSPSEAKDNPKAVNGILDLTDWSWEDDGVVALDGQWEFYWKKLLTPDDFAHATGIEASDFLMVPRAWNSHIVDEKTLAGDGYATYRLLINNVDSEQILGIKLPRIFTTYKLWLDGQLIASNGTIAPDKDNIVPQYLPKVRYIQPKSETFELVVQVANFHHRSGGILESLHLGPEQQVSSMRTSNLALELFLFGSLFIIGFYHIGLFIFRTKDKSTLYFGVYSILIAMRTVLVGEIYFIHMFPGFSWEVAHKIQTLAYYMAVPLFFIFLKSIFPKDISRKIFGFILIFGLCFSLLVILTPAKVFTQFNPIYQLFSLLLIPYALYVFFTICYNKREGAYLISAGAVCLVFFSLNDIVFLSVIMSDSDNHFLRNYITKGNLSSWGLLIFVFAQSIVLAKKLSKSFVKVESMSVQLRQLNQRLEEKVRERTYALETSTDELKLAYQALSLSEKSRQHLVQNISHDLRTPLTSVKGYVGAILDGIVPEPNQQKKYLNRIIDKVDLLDHMVQQLMELSQLESRQLPLKLKPTPLRALITSITDKYALDFKTANVTFNITYPQGWANTPDWGEDLWAKVDMNQLDRVFTNLFSNALAHTPDCERIYLNISVNTTAKELLVEVSDTGIGIPNEDIDHIFERFYMVTKARQTSGHKSTGLGLAIAKEIVKYHGGQIWVTSQVGSGSNFFFTLPVFELDEFVVSGDNIG